MLPAQDGPAVDCVFLLPDAPRLALRLGVDLVSFVEQFPRHHNRDGDGPERPSAPRCIGAVESAIRGAALRLASRIVVSPEDKTRWAPIQLYDTAHRGQRRLSALLHRRRRHTIIGEKTLRRQSVAEPAMNVYRILADVDRGAAFRLRCVRRASEWRRFWLGIVRRWSWVRNFWFRTVHLLMIADRGRRVALRHSLPADRLGRPPARSERSAERAGEFHRPLGARSAVLSTCRPGCCRSATSSSAWRSCWPFSSRRRAGRGVGESVRRARLTT